MTLAFALLNPNFFVAYLISIACFGLFEAIYMANAGGAWDNAKKIIEDEPSDPAHNQGKGSERHMASIVGDTVGDPMKDTAGPALNPMIKVVNLVSVIIAPIIVKYKVLPPGGKWAVVVLVAILMMAILYSKKKPPEMSGEIQG
jgi:K(+)-stimulated pyrophosphate-energized sodium pump